MFLSILILPACPMVLAGGAAGGGYVWYDSEITRVHEKSLSEVTTAVKLTLKGLGLPMVDMSREGDEIKVKSEFKDGKGIKVKLERIDNQMTLIGIRVGVARNKERARYFMEEVEKRL